MCILYNDIDLDGGDDGDDDFDQHQDVAQHSNSQDYAAQRCVYCIMILILMVMMIAMMISISTKMLSNTPTVKTMLLRDVYIV